MPESKSGAFTNLATPLHRTSVFTDQPLTVAGSPPLQGMSSQSAACSDPPGIRHAPEVNIIQRMRKHRTSGAGHSTFKTDRAKPFKGLSNGRTVPQCNRLQIIATVGKRVCCKA